MYRRGCTAVSIRARDYAREEPAKNDNTRGRRRDHRAREHRMSIAYVFFIGAVPMRKRRRLGRNTSRGVTMKRERGIHERAHLSTLDDRLSTDVEGEMVAWLHGFFTSEPLIHAGSCSHEELCERSQQRIALICAIFRDAGSAAGQRTTGMDIGISLSFRHFPLGRSPRQNYSAANKIPRASLRIVVVLTHKAEFLLHRVAASAIDCCSS